MGARHYDPVQGRFVTRDSRSGNVGEPWTWNLYTYCKNSPQNFIDPTGHSFYSAQDEAPQWVPDEELPYNAPGVQNIIEFAALVAVAWGLIAGTAAVATALGGKKLVESASAAAPSAQASTTGSMNLQLFAQTTRDQLLSKVSNAALRNAINELYKKGAKVGDGGTAAALRQEKLTNLPVGSKFHLQKAGDMLKHLEKLIKEQKLSPEDLKMAQDLIDDLKDALNR